MDYCEADLAPVVDEFTTKRVCKAHDCMLGSAICRLQWDTSIRKCGTDLDDFALINWQHTFERSKGAMHNP